jgi:hypothetical protein
MARKTTLPPQSADLSLSQSHPASGVGGTPIKRRRINGKVLLLAIALVVFIAGGVHLVHYLMVGRNAAVLLDHAKAEREQGNYREAATYVARYLRLRPGDVDALEQLADLLRRSSNSREDWTDVLASLEQVLRLEPNRHEARRMAIETAMKLRRFNDADKHLQLLFTQRSDLAEDPDLMLAAARAAAEKERLQDSEVGEGAFTRYLALIDRHPTKVAPYEELAQIIRSKPSALPSQADAFPKRRNWTRSDLKQVFPEKRGESSPEEVSDKLLELMVKVGEPKGEAYLARASFRNAHGDLEGASADLRQAKGQPGADDSKLNLVAASVELAQARKLQADNQLEAASAHLDLARDAAQQGLSSPARDPLLYGLLAQITLEQPGDRDRQALLLDAENFLRDGLK